MAYGRECRAEGLAGLGESWPEYAARILREQQEAKAAAAAEEFERQKAAGEEQQRQAAGALPPPSNGNGGEYIEEPPIVRVFPTPERIPIDNGNGYVPEGQPGEVEPPPLDVTIQMPGPGVDGGWIEERESAPWRPGAPPPRNGAPAALQAGFGGMSLPVIAAIVGGGVLLTLAAGAQPRRR